MLAGELAQEIRYAMRLGDNQSDAAYVQALHVVNQAGQRIVVAKKWQFLNGASAEVTFDSDGKGELPLDFAELTAAYNAGGGGARLCTIEQVIASRGSSLGGYLAVGSESTATGMRYYLQSSGDSGTASIVYRRGWLPVTKDEDPILMPNWMHPLLAEVCRRYADLVEGGMDESPGFSGVDAVMRGPLFLEAARNDGLVQTQFGESGARRREHGSVYLPLDTADWRQP